MIVKKHLSHDVRSSCLDFLFQKIQVTVQVGRFAMFFRVTGHTDTKIHGARVQEVCVQINALVEVGDLFHQIQCMFVAIGFRHKNAGSGLRIATHHQHIVDVEKLEVDEGVFGFLTGKASADDMWHHINSKPVFDGGRNSHRSRPFANGMLLHQVVGQVFVHHFLLVVGDVDKSRIELHQRIDGLLDAVEIVPF